jgi:signal transduction histidine kinase/ligand-binding sensor domain-containing protein
MGATRTVFKLLLTFFLWQPSPHALALNLALDVSQYAHMAWRTQEGFATGGILSIAQTTDGYLWLGTEFGLFRFDGVRNVRPSPPQGASLPDSHIRCLLGAHDGALWIGTYGGLARWKGDRLTVYPQLSGWFINALVEDRQGIVWASAQVPTAPFAKLCAISDVDAQCEGDDGRFGRWVASLHEDGKGRLWVTAATGLWRWRPGPPQVQPLPAPPNDGLHDITDGDSGALLIITGGDITELGDGKGPLPFAELQGSGATLLRDRDGALWVGTQGRGLLHIHHGRTDTFGKSDGLSSERVSQIFEDREGNIWVATVDGLDRFHAVAAATVSQQQGLSYPVFCSIVASADGSIWISTAHGVNHWSASEKTIYLSQREHAANRKPVRGALVSAVREIVVEGLPTSGGALFQDRHGRLWVGSGYLEHERYVTVNGIPHEFVDAVEDNTQNLWFAEPKAGLVLLQPDQPIRQFSLQQLGLQSPVSRLTVDPQDGGLWLGLRAGGIAHLVDGRIRTSYSATDGLTGGRVQELRFDRDGALWIGAQGGLSRLKRGRIATLDSSSGLPCNSVSWMIDDDMDGVWLHTACGIARIARNDLESWAADVDRQNDRPPKIPMRIFNESDGVRSSDFVSTYVPNVAMSKDGRVWFGTLGGVGVLDPQHLPYNSLLPPVHVEEVIADRETYEASSRARFPPRIRDLQVNYTALSLVAPEKLMFRYKLEGHDHDWQNVGNRRQAFYTDLPPGNYRFRVIASNNSGVWNEKGASLDFSIAPAYWQTTWFRALCVAAFLAFLWMLYWLRMRQLAHVFETRVEAQVEERTRLARELHDTLLQSFNGLLLRFRTVQALFSKSPEEARKILDSAIDQTREALTEGRQAVQGLRSSAIGTQEFADAIKTLTEELAADPAHPAAAEVRLNIEGTPRPLRPLIRDEIYRIASEALRNAFRHAGASRIEVQLGYDEVSFELRVRDDGKGIDPQLLTDESLPGHFGLRGMRERGERMGGKLTLWSAPGSGTELVLSVPAANAYGTDASAAHSWLGRKIYCGGGLKP